MAGYNPFSSDPQKTMWEVAHRTAAKKARNEEHREWLEQEMWMQMLELQPKHDPSRGNLGQWLQFHADNIDSKTLNSPLSYKRDPAMRYRTLLGTNETYDSFMHAAEAIGCEKFEATVAWLNAGPVDPYFEQTFNDVHSDFFGEDLAIDGSAVEDEVLAATAISEVMTIFAEQCDPRAYTVWNLHQQFPDWTFAQIGEQLDPPISKATVHRDLKSADAALLACGQIWWTQQHDQGEGVA